MKKSGFFTMCWAFIPGAAQMYQGYMKRGLSLVGLFCFGLFLTACAGILGMTLPVVYMYSFFDGLNLHEQIRLGENPPDDYLFHLGLESGLAALLSRGHKLVGWALVALGAVMLYENFLAGWLWELSRLLPGLSFLADLLRSLPTLALAVVLIFFGLYLVRGGKSGKGGGSGIRGEAPAAPVPWDEEEV